MLQEKLFQNKQNSIITLMMNYQSFQVFIILTFVGVFSDLKTILIVFQMFLSTTHTCSNLFRSQLGPLNKKAVLKTIWFHTFHKQRETRTCEINGAAQQQSCRDINYIYTTAETKQKLFWLVGEQGETFLFLLGEVDTQFRINSRVSSSGETTQEHYSFIRFSSVTVTDTIHLCSVILLI